MKENATAKALRTLGTCIIVVGILGAFCAFFGSLFGVLVILRIIWGFVGTKYSRFKDFELKGLFAYLKSALQAKHQNTNIIKKMIKKLTESK